MEPTIEVRWFQRGHCPAPVDDWFRHALDSASSIPPAHEERQDLYLHLPGSEDLGIKLRGPHSDKVEIKRRQQDSGLTTLHSGIVGRVEHWIRWSFNIDANNPGVGDPTRPPGAWVLVGKTRDSRTFTVQPDGSIQEVAARDGLLEGCTAELAHVDTAGQTWWTFALEAFGPPGSVRRNFDAIARRIFEERPSPYAFSADCSLSYPAWVGQHGQNELR